MLIRQLMQKNLITCSPSSTVHDAAAKMKQYNIGSVLIVEEGSKLKGILTDRDIALNVVGDSKDPKTTIVSEIMTADPVSINSDADVESALNAMSQANVRRLPVTQNGKVIGLVSSADLAVEIKQEFDQFIGLEEAFSKHA